jgi:hypothetical protein
LGEEGERTQQEGIKSGKYNENAHPIEKHLTIYNNKGISNL